MDFALEYKTDFSIKKSQWIVILFFFICDFLPDVEFSKRHMSILQFAYVRNAYFNENLLIAYTYTLRVWILIPGSVCL